MSTLSSTEITSASDLTVWNTLQYDTGEPFWLRADNSVV